MANTAQHTNNNAPPGLFEIDIVDLNGGNAVPLEDIPHHFLGNNGTNRFGFVRDRLFHVMLVKMALSYNRRCTYSIRRIVEFVALLTVLNIFKLIII